MIFNVQRELNYMYKPEFLDIGRSKFEHKKKLLYPTKTFSKLWSKKQNNEGDVNRKMSS